MDTYILIMLAIGLLLLVITLSSGWLNRLPLSYALIYLIAGIGLSPYGLNLIQVRPDAEFLERLTEFVVLISLFSCGLKISCPLRHWNWNATVRLIGGLMPLTIAAVAATAHYGLGMGWGGAVLLGAILAPTDPVLASDVQLTSVNDRDTLRFGLTSEGGLNDALAFPFVYFGLHWIEDPKWHHWILEWTAVDLLWEIGAGIVMGVVVARIVAKTYQQLQRIRPSDEVMEVFVSLGTVLLVYSLTELAHGYGFIAVFVAGVVVQRTYDPEKQQVHLEFTETIEKLLEVGTILLLGSLLRIEPMLRFLPQTLLIAGLLLFVIRPIGAWICTTGEGYRPIVRGLFGWFGIRGVGSIYYLTFALGEGLEGGVGEQIAWITLSTIVLSVVLHGVTSTPLMKWYERQTGRQQKRARMSVRNQ
ncbi:sodium:proton antiporter [Pseudanabaena sp. FACHB-2040]|uniref:cation:proton antiporter n=1 Tax=Pseudanabaena sp. FACHB-2040 TaxID=2692859 RepID=UPI0032200772